MKKRSPIQGSTPRSSRIIAVISSLIIFIGLLLPIYTITLKLPLQGLGEFDYEIGYSLLSTTTKSSINLNLGLPSNVKNYSAKTDGVTSVNELLNDSGFPDVRRIASEAGFPLDISMLPVDIEKLAKIAESSDGTTKIPLLSSESDLQRYIPSLPGSISTIPVADIVSLGLRFAPLMFIVPPFVGIFRGRYGKAASTFILILTLPFMISLSTPILTVSMNNGWHIMLLGSTILIVASMIQRRESRIWGKEAKPVKY